MLLQVNGADSYSGCWQSGAAHKAELSLEPEKKKMTFSPNQSSA